MFKNQNKELDRTQKREVKQFEMPSKTTLLKQHVMKNDDTIKTNNMGSKTKSNFLNSEQSSIKSSKITNSNNKKQNENEEEDDEEEEEEDSEENEEEED